MVSGAAGTQSHVDAEGGLGTRRVVRYLAGERGLEGETAVRLLLQMLSGRAALFLHVPRSMQENPSFASRAVVENLSILQFIPKGESYKTTSCRYSCLAVKAPLSSPLATDR